MTNERGNIERRSILKAGILAAGAALVPSSPAAASSGRGALETWRAEYYAHVARFAATVAPEFSDSAAAGRTTDELAELSEHLEDRCCAEFCATMEDAHGVLAASRYWHLDNWHNFDDVRVGVACAAACDVADAIGARWHAEWTGRA